MIYVLAALRKNTNTVMEKFNHIHVAIGIVYRENKVLVAKRGSHQHCPDVWEFPGGKCENNETPVQTLARELLEEVGITVQLVQPLTTFTHQYPSRKVTLHAFWVTDFLSEPFSKEGQPLRWVTIDELPDLSMPEGNASILEQISLKQSIK